MKSIKQYSQTLLLLTLLLSGCGAYLDVNPKSEVTDKELFSTAEGCEDAIYGIYAEIGGERNGLYGQMLAYKYPELMTGNFTINQSDNMAYVVQRQWTHDNAIAVAEEIWTTGYKVIGHVNKALSHILPKDDSEFRHTRLYKGELLALRAFLHFEMARIFAVSFASGDAAAKAKAIPYVKSYGIQVTPYSSLDKVFEFIIADLTDIQGVYFTFDPVNVGSITEDTPRFYLDNVRLINRDTPHSTETNLEFGENEIIDFERFYHKYFLINDFGVDMGIVNAADYGISASSGSKVLRLVVPGTNTGSWNYYVQLMAPFLEAGALGQLTDEQFENAYFCWDAYNTSEAEYNVVAIFELGTGAEDYRVGSYPKKNQWTTVRVKLTDIETNLEGWRENMGMFVFSIRDEYAVDRELFFDNFRVEFE